MRLQPLFHSALGDDLDEYRLPRGMRQAAYHDIRTGRDDWLGMPLFAIPTAQSWQDDLRSDT